MARQRYFENYFHSVSIKDTCNAAKFICSDGE